MVIQKEDITADEVLERVSDGFYALGEDWRFTYINSRGEEILQASRDELLGETVWDSFPGLVGTEVERSFREAKETSESDELSYYHEPFDRWYRIYLYPSETGMSVCLTDITEKVEAQRRLERTKEKLVLVNRIMRHDIRNDMNVVLGWSEELRDHVDDEGEEILERILRTTNHTVELTATARDFVEAVTAEGIEELEAVPLDEAVYGEVERCSGMYGDDVFTVDDIPDVEVRANALLSSVLSNVLDNAVEHSDKDEPRVEVTAETDEERVRVRVADNGPGVPTEKREAVFGRGEDGLDDPDAGLGLHLVDTVVRGYGGDVWIEENDPDGAVFVIEVPLVGQGGDRDG